MNTLTTTAAQFTKPVSVAFLLGASDAEAGAAFAPEMFYVRNVDKIMYSLGFEQVRGASEVTRQFTASVNWSGN